MQTPVTKELPPIPPDLAGWPWQAPSWNPLPPMSPSGKPWPRISIVAPSYNQGQTLEETLRSVLLQGYPELELVVIDGGSTDNTLAILERYDPWLTYWCSEPDRGQSHAINKGFARCAGEVFAWINTDDLLAPGALERVGTEFAASLPPDVLYGNAEVIDEQGRKIEEIRSVPFSAAAFLHGSVHLAVQSAVFWRGELYRRVGGVDERLRYAMDVDLYVRFLEAGARFRFVHANLGAYRQYGTSKTIANPQASAAEAARIPGLAAVRARPGYRARRMLYRLRQFAWLFLQGDFLYMKDRLFQRRSATQ